MKFIYIDESGDGGAQGDVFVMCGLMVDAYKLRKKTADFDALLEGMIARHPGTTKELKTSRFINGLGAWKHVPAVERKDFLRSICELAVSNGGKVFGFGLSFERFNAALEANHGQPSGKSYWLASAMFVTSMVQKKMQNVEKSKGLTVVIMDDNQREMPSFSESLYGANPWYDGLYQVKSTKRGKTIWLPRAPKNRFDQIINTAFAVKSNHSSLVQVADAISWVYRRHIELMTLDEAYAGEKDFYAELVGIVDGQRENLGRCNKSACINFYNAAKHPNWDL